VTVERLLQRALKAAVFVACLVPMTLIGWDLAMGNIRGEWIKEITHRTGHWGLGIIVATLAVTPLRRLTGLNRLGTLRRMLGLFAFFYLGVHFAIYLVLDQFFDWHTIVKDVAKRPYITVGFTGFVLMVPLALTSTKGWVRRLGRRWVTLHSLIYVTALAGVVHFMWSVKADRLRPTLFGLALVGLLLVRLVPRGLPARLRVRFSERRAGAARTAPAPAVAD
jgi:sulfoxide reductase heme-binding subunit YedZ